MRRSIWGLDKRIILGRNLWIILIGYKLAMCPRT
jgi:hypothetical protein